MLNATFNAALATAVTDYSGMITAFTIDFTSPNSPSFFTGRLGIDDIVGSTPRKHNLLTLFGIKSINKNLEKPRTFSGYVTSGIDVWISYLKGAATQDFEAMPEALENTFYSIFNNRANATYWGPNVAFNGDIQVQCSEVIKDDLNWRRLITVTLTHEVSI